MKIHKKTSETAMKLALSNLIVFFIMLGFFLIQKIYGPIIFGTISNNLFSEFYKKNAISNISQYVLPDPDYLMEISTVNWMTEELTEKIRQKQNFDSCKLCESEAINNRRNANFHISAEYNPNSSERDAILSVMLHYSFNLETFIRSLRTTGCKAKVIVFHDDQSLQTLTPYMLDLIKNCGIIMINIGTVTEKFVRHTYELRHTWYFAFMKKYRNDFDRIIVSDISDVFFQADPFTTEFTNNTFQATTELIGLDKEDQNRDWIKSIQPNFDDMFWYGRIPLCFGLLYGSMETWITFYNILYEQDDWKHFEVKTIDQGYLNVYFYHNLFADNGLHITATMPDDLIVSARGTTGILGNDIETKYVLLKDSTKIPAMIHHYNRVCLFIDNIQEVCPSLNIDNSFAYAKPKETTC